MVLTDKTLLGRCKDILANEVGNDTVMMSIEKGKYYGTNKTGSYIWKILDIPMTFGDLCSRLAADFNITTAKCAEDMLPFIEQMEKEGIIDLK